MTDIMSGKIYYICSINRLWTWSFFINCL